MIARIVREVFTAGRFGLVGVTATAVHVLVVWLLLELTQLPVLAANFFAFLTAFCVTFLGNYYWTFARQGDPRQALKRLFSVSFAAMVVNNVVLVWLVGRGWLSEFHSALVALAVIPVITFLASRLWVFREQGRPDLP